MLKEKLKREIRLRCSGLAFLPTEATGFVNEYVRRKALQKLGVTQDIETLTDVDAVLMVEIDQMFLAEEIKAQKKTHRKR